MFHTKSYIKLETESRNERLLFSATSINYPGVGKMSRTFLLYRRFPLPIPLYFLLESIEAGGGKEGEGIGNPGSGAGGDGEGGKGRSSRALRYDFVYRYECTVK